MSEVNPNCVTAESINDKAKAQGLVCFFPQDNEVQLDLDGGAVVNTRVLAVLAANGLTVLSQIETVSKSGNRHVHIRFDHNIDEEQRLIIQACLGSDPVREVLSLIRIKNCSEESSALFETPQEAEKVSAWKS